MTWCYVYFSIRRMADMRKVAYAAARQLCSLRILILSFFPWHIRGMFIAE